MNVLTRREQMDLTSELMTVIDRASTTLCANKPYTHTYNETLSFELWATYFNNSKEIDTITVIGRVHDIDYEGITLPCNWSHKEMLNDLQYLVRMCVKDAD